MATYISHPQMIGVTKECFRINNNNNSNYNTTHSCHKVVTSDMFERLFVCKCYIM